ncbi:MAG: PE-PPE domain-containing protein [Mycobacterium sp.]|nr:PE-PPE domain-containing protein [Mycobacterium sp.]
MQRSYLDAADTLYLQPRDFTGTPQALDTPEGFYPTTGVNSLTADASEAQGAQILDGAITGRIADGNVDAANPVVVFGYSQSSALSTFTMQQLQADGVPSDDVHFVLVGDTAAPNGGLLERFDLSDFPSSDLTVPSFGVTFGNPTPDDLYPTDIYTLEYDGFADFPQYPIDPLSDLNAFAGMIYEHLTYLDLDPGQIQNAIPLETLQSAGGTLTDYYMIGVQDLPLLDPLRLIPFVGNPLADLLQPDVTVLVNLGYGSIADGWRRGAARHPGSHRRSGKSGQLPNPLAAGQPDVGAARGCGLHVRAHRHPAADVVGTHPGAPRRKFSRFRRDFALATGRSRQHAFR